MLVGGASTKMKRFVSRIQKGVPSSQWVFSLIKCLIAEGPESTLTREGDQRLDSGLCGRME